MTNLYSLDLSGNRLTSADVLGNLINNSTSWGLSVDVGNNKIASFSEWNVSIDAASRLNLGLSHNFISRIPKW